MTAADRSESAADRSSATADLLGSEGEAEERGYLRLPTQTLWASCLCMDP